MKFGEKDFSFYWKIIKWPLIILTLWNIASLIASIISFQTYQNIFSSSANLIISIALFGIVGYLTVKDYKGGIKNSAWAGATLGVIAGFIGGIIGVLIVILVPAVMTTTVNLAIASAKGAAVDRTMIENVIRITTYLGIIISPVIYGLIGAFISAIGGLTGKKL